MSWRLHPYFWIRSAGFPASALLDLAVSSEPPFEAETLRARGQLLSLLGSELAREAVFLSNQEAGQRISSLIEKGPATVNARTRQHFRLAWSYAQRLFTKNDTTSFFGPIAWGRFAEAPRCEPRAPERPWIDLRNTSFELWAIRALAQSIVDDPTLAELVPMRLAPECHLEGESLFYPRGQQRVVRGTLFRVLSAISARPGVQLAQLKTTCEPWDATHDAQLTMLLEKRIVLRELGVPTAVTRPERWLREQLVAMGPRAEGWLARLDELTALREQYQAGDLTTKTRVTAAIGERLSSFGVDLERRLGAMYVGRYPLYEDCGRNLTLELPLTLRRELEQQLTPVLDLYRWTASAVGSRIRHRWLGAFDTLAEGRTEVDLLRFLHAVSALEATWTGEVRTLLREAWDALLGDARGDLVSLASSELGGLVRWLRAREEWCLEPRLGERTHSPDVLLAATSFEAILRGEYRIIIGETHPGVHTMSQPVAQPFCPWPEEVLGEVDRLLAPGTMVLGDPPQSYQRSHINWLAADALYEIVPPGGCSRARAERQVPIGRCELVRDGQQLFVRDRSTGRRTEVTEALPGALHRALFALAADVVGAARSERIVSGKVTLKRMSRVFRGDQVPEVERPAEDGRDFERIRTWAREQGLPRWVFSKSKEEPKPIFVDFDNPFAVDLFVKQARQASTVVVSEMSPGPDELWLSDARGRYTSELRCSFSWQDEARP